MALIKISEEKTHLALEFHAPDSSNALSLAAARELASAAKKHKSWRRPVIVTSAHPRLFCSGGNLSDYKKLKGKAAGLKVNREITNCLNTFANWRAAKLAVIEGDVLGGGMEWLACFEYRWCTPEVMFAFWQRRIGLSFGWGGGRRWTAAVGEDQTRKLLMEAALIPAESALGLGLIDRIIPKWKIRAESSRFADLLDSEILHRLRNWSAKSETKIFSDLWLAPAHKKFLASW